MTAASLIAASLTQSPLWLTSGWVMLHFLWVAAAVAGVAGVTRLALPGQARCRYVVALMCFSAVAVAPFFIVWAVHLQEPQRALAVAPTHSSEPLTTTVIAFSQIPSPDQHVPLSQAVVEVAVRSLPGVWLIGAPIALLIMVTGVIGGERLRRQSRLLAHDPVADRCRHLADALGIARQVAIGVCDRLATPILVGIVKPMILLPPAALTGWSPQQVEMVLLHELAHVRRWDSLVNLLQRTVEGFLFFHPAVWWLSAWVRLEREVCCDRLVVAHTGDARAYAETLAALAQTQTGPALAGAVAMTEHRLVTRIRRILNVEDRTMRVSVKFLGLVVAVFVAGAFMLGIYAQDPGDGGRQPQPPQKKSEAPRHTDPETPPKKDEDKGAKDSKAVKPGKKVTPSVGKDSAFTYRDKRKIILEMRGLIEASEQVELHTRVGGTVEKVHFNLGDQVKKGQLLVELSVPELGAERVQKEAVVQQAEAMIEQARSSVQAAQAALAAVKAQQQEAEAILSAEAAKYGFHKTQFDRIQALAKVNQVAQAEVDQARLQLQDAKGRLSSAEAKHQSAKANIQESAAKFARAEADLRVAMAQVRVAQADVQRVAVLLQFAKLRSPLDGVVVRQSAVVGANVQSAIQGNARPLVTVARTDVLRIAVEINGASVGLVQIGIPVQIRVDAFPNKSWEAQVTRRAGALNPMTDSLRVEIDVPNTDGLLLPGMSATVAFKSAK